MENGTQVQAKDDCQVRLRRHLFLQTYSRQKSVSSEETLVHFTNPTHQQNQEFWRAMVISLELPGP